MKELSKEKAEKAVKKIKKSKKYNSLYEFKKNIKYRIKNSQIFCNIKNVRDDGILVLKTGEYARVIEISAVDLSLTNISERDNFFYRFKDLYQINHLKLKCYKFDKKINLNLNKEYYESLIDKFSDDKTRLELLVNHSEFIDYLEKENLTYSSSYYLVFIAKELEVLKKQVEEAENILYNIVPRMNYEIIDNKLEIYSFLANLYYSDVNLDQLMWLNLPELICPLSLQEKSNYLQIDDKEVQLVTIKNIPAFVDAMFLDGIFNIPNIKACINVSDTIDTDDLISNIDSSYQFLLSDRNTTKKLSSATELDTEKERYQLLMNDLKNGDEKVKEVNLIIAIEGDRKQRDEMFREITRIAKDSLVKYEIPRLRQLEAWQAFDITGSNLKDYCNYLPTMTLSAGFPFSKTYFNDYTGYLLGEDLYTHLPIFFNPFYLNKKTRNSHNIAIVASTGGGKSYTMKKILVNEFARGTKIFILDAEGEYKKLVLDNGGEYIDLYSRKNGIINPLQIRYTPNDDDDRVIKSEDVPLAKHLAFLETFFKSTFEEITENELITLTNIVEALYNKKGINSKTSIEELEKLSNEDYPIFEDLVSFMAEYKERTKSPEKIKVINQLEILVSRFLTGTDAYLFNGYTTIDLSNNLIAFGMKDLLFGENKRLKNTQTLNLLTYLNNAVVSNKINNDKLEQKYKKPIMIVADEFHLFIDEENGEVLRSIGQLARRIRKYYGSIIVASQSIEDFIGNNQILRHAKAIFNNCQYQMVGMLNEADMNAYLELFKENRLTDTQKAFLLKASQGDFLLNVTRKKRLRIHIEAMPLEVQMMGEGDVNRNKK